MRPIWSEFYYLLAGHGSTKEGDKVHVIPLEYVAIEPKLPRQVYSCINNKARREARAMKDAGFTDVKNKVVKYERYEGERTEVYTGGEGYYFWLEDEALPLYLLL